jgi:hypothetical protein
MNENLSLKTPIPQIVRALSPTLVETILTHLQTEAKDTFAAIMVLFCEKLKYRPNHWKSWPKERQREWLRANWHQNRFASTTQQLLQEWFFSQRITMLNSFLDALGIARNEEGCITGDVADELDATKVREGTETLLKDFPAEEVALYLHLFQYGKENGWTSIGELLKTDARLSLGLQA